MANPTTYSGHVRSRTCPDGITGSGYTQISSYVDNNALDWSAVSTVGKGWLLTSSNTSRWALGALGNLANVPAVNGVQVNDIKSGMNLGTFDTLQVMRQSMGQEVDMRVWALGSGPRVGLGLKTLNRLAVDFNTGTFQGLQDGSSNYMYLPATPVPISFGVSTGASTYTATARMYGWSNSFTKDSVDKSAAYGASSFWYVGGNGTTSAGQYRGAFCDGPRGYSSAISGANWADYRDTWTPSRTLTLHPTNPAFVVVHIGTSRTAGWFTFGDDSWVGRIAQRYIGNSVHYNWGWPGVDAATLLANVSLYTAGLATLKSNWPNAMFVVILECGANDAGADGRGTYPSASSYDNDLASFVFNLQGAIGDNFRCLKMTSAPFCYPTSGNNSLSLTRQSNLDSYNAKDRLNAVYNGVIDVARHPTFALSDSTFATLSTMCKSSPYQTGSSTDATPAAANYDGIHFGQNGNITMDTILSQDPVFIANVGGWAGIPIPLRLRIPA